MRQFSVQNQLCDALKELSEKGRIKIIKEKIGEFEVKDYKLIIATSEDLALNNSIALIANNNNIPVTVVDHQEQYSFLFPYYSGPFSTGHSCYELWKITDTFQIYS